MPYLRRLVLLLTLSTSLLLVSVHLLHFSRPHHQEPLHPVISKEQAEKDLNYPKQNDHPIDQQDLVVPTREYANRIAFWKESLVPPRKEDLQVPEQKDSKPNPTSKPVDQKDSEPVPKPAEQKDPKSKFKFNEVKYDNSRVAPPNATAWHKDKNLWKVVDALNGLDSILAPGFAIVSHGSQSVEETALPPENKAADPGAFSRKELWSIYERRLPQAEA